MKLLGRQVVALLLILTMLYSIMPRVIFATREMEDRQMTEATKSAENVEIATKARTSEVGEEKNASSRTYVAEDANGSDDGEATIFGNYSMSQNIHFIAHRGYSLTAPENTLIAYQLAKEMGFTHVECDVSFTADQVAVLLHDDTIDRTSDGSGKISELTYEELLQYDFGSWKSFEYTGVKIPTFDEFMVLCAKLDLYPHIELKESGEYTLERVQQLMNIVDKYDMRKNCSWISFNKEFLTYVRNSDPTARLGFIKRSDATREVIDIAKSLRNGHNEVFLVLNYRYLTDTGVWWSSLNGFPLEVYTINSEKEILFLPAYVSGVTSDGMKYADNFSGNYKS